MVRPPAPRTARSGPAPRARPKQQTQGGRWSQLEDTNHSMTPRRALQKVACCERGLSTACREGRKENLTIGRKKRAAPAEGQPRALGPPSAPTPLPSQAAPCRETRAAAQQVREWGGTALTEARRAG